RPAGVFFEEPLEFGAKLLVAPRFFILALQLFESRHQGFGDVTAAIGTKAAGDRLCFLHSSHAHLCSAFLTPATNAIIFSGSLRAGSRSMPETTSTPHGENV